MAKRKKNRTTLIIIILLIVVIALIAAVAIKKRNTRGIEVQVGKSTKADITAYVSASGLVEPENEVKIAPDVSGEIIELYVEEGDSVEQDELLIKIRPDNLISILDRTEANLNQQRANLADAQARAARAQANFEQAQRNYERNQTLLDEGVISDAEFEQVQAEYLVAKNELESAMQSVDAARYVVESAKASVREAQENVNLTNVYAPVGGIISKLNVEKGERVVGTQQMAGTEMLRIADLNKMQVTVDVNENDIIRISNGDTAIIEVDAYEPMDKKFKGVVFQIASTANEKSTPDAVTEFEVEIRILNSSYRDLIENEGITLPFRPGMTASVEIITEKKEDILTVPLAAVTTRPKKELSVGKNKGDRAEKEETDVMVTEPEEDEEVEVVFIYNEEENQVSLQQVSTGISDLEKIEINEGLEDGQKIITGPFIAVSNRLRDGNEVRVKENNTPKND